MAYNPFVARQTATSVDLRRDVMNVGDPNPNDFKRFNSFTDWGSSETASPPNEPSPVVGETDWGEVEISTPGPTTVSVEIA